MRLVAGAFAVFLIIHGLIHLMGTTVYMKLGRIDGLPYKTTLLSGRWQLSEHGMRAFGALWVIPTLGFVLAGIALLANVAAWMPLAVGAAVVSLVLTVLDLKAAYAGALLNLLVLTVAWASTMTRLR
jgi:hypothetical protein